MRRYDQLRGMSLEDMAHELCDLQSEGSDCEYCPVADYCRPSKYDENGKAIIKGHNGFYYWLYEEIEPAGKTRLFECDPDKNVKCSKTGCKFSADVAPHLRWCHRTTIPEYSWDGVTEREVKSRIENKEDDDGNSKA